MSKGTVYILHILLICYITAGTDIFILVHILGTALRCNHISRHKSGDPLLTQTCILRDLLDIRLASQLFGKRLYCLGYSPLVRAYALWYVHYIFTLGTYTVEPP